MQTNNKLYKSQDDKALFGVCGGIAEYFKVDSIIVRLLFVLFTLMYGAGLLFYIIAALVIPTAPPIYSAGNMAANMNPERFNSVESNAGSAQYIAQDGTKYENRAASPTQNTEEEIKTNPENAQTKTTSHHSGNTIGIVLIAVGGLILLQVFLPWIDRRLIVASCMIFAGFIFLTKKPK